MGSGRDIRMGTIKSGCLGGKIQTRASSAKAELWSVVCVPDSCGKALLFRGKNIVLVILRKEYSSI
jgi:hypothetical protein